MTTLAQVLAVWDISVVAPAAWIESSRRYGQISDDGGLWWEVQFPDGYCRAVGPCEAAYYSAREYPVRIMDKPLNPMEMGALGFLDILHRPAMTGNS